MTPIPAIPPSCELPIETTKPITSLCTLRYGVFVSGSEDGITRWDARLKTWSHFTSQESGNQNAVMAIEKIGRGRFVAASRDTLTFWNDFYLKKPVWYHPA